MRILILALAGLAAAVLSSCAGEPDVCESFPDALEQETDWYAVKRPEGRDFERANEIARLVRHCYYQQDYARLDQSIVLQSVVEQDPDKMIVVFDFFGLEDVRIGFESPDGTRVNRAFEFSTL